MKKIILIAAGCLALAGSLYFFFTQGKVASLNAINTKLEAIEIDAWKSLEEIGISKEKCLSQIAPIEKEFYETVAKKPRISPKISQKTVNLAKEVLASFGVNTDQISIDVSTENSPAEVCEDTLLINEQVLTSFSVNAQKFILGHEAQHLIHKDCFCKIAIDDLADEKGDWESPQTNYPLNIFSRFIEWRADIKTALTNPEYAQGYIEFAQKRNAQEPLNDQATSHPLFKQRLALAHEIYNTMRTA